MQAIILAAGRGKRIKALTKDKPKCLLPLGNETIIERELRLLNEVGIKSEDIFIVTGYQSDMLKNMPANIIYNDCYDSKDNSYSLYLGLREISDDVIIIDSDLCFDKDALLAIIEDPRKNLVLSRISDDLSESTGIQVIDEKLVAIGKNYKNTGYVYLSIFKIGKETIEDFQKALQSERSAKTWYTLAITEICSTHTFYNKIYSGRWHEIDDPNDYYETLKLFNLGE